jgi:NTP pyrophosphatase (non-canonical NTP hydrolase)
MLASDYKGLAIRTANLEKDPLIHGAMGMAGESGEVVDIIKKHIFYGKTLDRTKVLEEIGDAAWYMNLLIASLGSSWGEVFRMNIDKLSARYPDLKFDADRAINRDDEAEKRAIVGG